jgi:hypothetical protein
MDHKDEWILQTVLSICATWSWSSPDLMDTSSFVKESFFHAENKNPYPAEIRGQVIALARAGRSVESLAREFEPCVATIHGWVKQTEIDDGTCVNPIEAMAKTLGVSRSGFPTVFGMLNPNESDLAVQLLH